MRRTRILAAALTLCLAPIAAHAATDCEMTFELKGWSAFYKTAKGSGTIKCTNGQTAAVTLKTTGGGFTFGKSEIVGGTGKFSEVQSIDALFGSYAAGDAHAGAGKSAAAAAMTKGEVSLSLAGTGKGVDVGFAFSKFTITKK
jgi:hypothetical protein